MIYTSTGWPGQASFSACRLSLSLGWVSSQHGGLKVNFKWLLPSPRTRVLRDQGRSYKASCVLSLEVTKHCHYCSLFVVWSQSRFSVGKDYTKAWILAGVNHWEAIFGDWLPQGLSITFYMVAGKDGAQNDIKRIWWVKKDGKKSGIILYLLCSQEWIFQLIFQSLANPYNPYLWPFSLLPLWRIYLCIQTDTKEWEKGQPPINSQLGDTTRKSGTLKGTCLRAPGWLSH